MTIGGVMTGLGTGGRSIAEIAIASALGIALRPDLDLAIDRSSLVVVLTHRRGKGLCPSPPLLPSYPLALR